ncbi:MAG: GNAT family N-acetyltransferase [Nostocales cyanobacterium]|nr:MAG: GNAT family N-acetyltransferase [Nostocales cyanobacterium]TAF11320.1 MAG: GNAT family N-acetyltransferase [Nostocales cyanobacterium]
MSGYCSYFVILKLLATVINIEISLAKSEDFENILALQEISLRLLISKEYNSQQIESLIRDQRLARTRLDEIIFLAHSGSQLVGFAALLRHTPEIGAVFVHPDFIRQGIGTNLLKAVENKAIENKYKTIYVMSSLSAVNFYRSLGYERIQKSGFYSEGKIWVSSVNMKKQLIPMTTREILTRKIIFIVVVLILLFIVIVTLMQLV